MSVSNLSMLCMQKSISALLILAKLNCLSVIYLRGKVKKIHAYYLSLAYLQFYIWK